MRTVYNFKATNNIIFLSNTDKIKGRFLPFVDYQLRKIKKLAKSMYQLVGII